MSDQSDEDMLETRSSARSGPGASAARKISALSDDESNDEVPAASAVRRDTPPLSPAPRSESPTPSGDDHHQSRRSPKRPVDSYNRSVAADANHVADISVNVVHLPPSVSLSSSLTTNLEDVPPESNPMLFRLRDNATARTGESPTDTCLRHLQECGYDPNKYNEFLESNANLITWNDGSQTLSIGNLQFQLVEDAIASQNFIFRRGDKLQTHHAAVGKVVRVQPTSTGDARAKLVMAKAVERAANKGSTSKTILRCMEDDVERKEKQARLEQHRRERERARQDAKKRQMKERHARPTRQLSANILEDNDDDSADDGVKGLADRYDANRLLRAKRAPLPPSRPPADLALKRRKVGARRVLAKDDDSESD